MHGERTSVVLSSSGINLVVIEAISLITAGCTKIEYYW